MGMQRDAGLRWLVILFLGLEALLGLLGSGCSIRAYRLSAGSTPEEEFIMARAQLLQRQAAEAQYQAAVAQFQTAEAQYQAAVTQRQAAEAQYQAALAQLQPAEAQYQAALAQLQTAEAQYQAVAQRQAAEAQYQAAVTQRQAVEAQRQAAETQRREAVAQGQAAVTQYQAAVAQFQTAEALYVAQRQTTVTQYQAALAQHQFAKLHVRWQAYWNSWLQNQKPRPERLVSLEADSIKTYTFVPEISLLSSTLISPLTLLAAFQLIRSSQRRFNDSSMIKRARFPYAFVPFSSGPVFTCSPVRTRLISHTPSTLSVLRTQISMTITARPYSLGLPLSKSLRAKSMQVLFVSTYRRLSRDAKPLPCRSGMAVEIDRLTT